MSARHRRSPSQEHLTEGVPVDVISPNVNAAIARLPRQSNASQFDHPRAGPP